MRRSKVRDAEPGIAPGSVIIGMTVSWDRSVDIIADGIYLNDLTWSGTFIIQGDADDKWTKAEFKEGLQLSVLGGGT